MAVKAPPDEVQRIISLALDAAFYRSVYADIREAAEDPLKHYAHLGWREGRDPAPWFSTRRYLAANPDIAKDDQNPFYHYLRTGRREGREVFPSEHASDYYGAGPRTAETPAWSLSGLLRSTPGVTHAVAATPVRPSERIRRLVGGEFNADYYLSAHAKLPEGVDPLDHFLERGWREWRDPNPHFSVRDYLELYPDVVQSGINPFIHYLRSGRSEGRLARQPLGFRYDILANIETMEQRLAKAAHAAAAVKPGPGSSLAAALARSRTGLNSLHITFSHDDYTANVGGVQLCLQREASAVAGMGRDHLHIYPAKPWPVLRTEETAALGVVWNGEPAGAYRAITIAKALGKAVPGSASRDRSFAIHSLLGHSVDETLAILSAAGMPRGYFWLHDFASLCAGYHLSRNDVQDCSAPPPDSAACGICVYGPWRSRHTSEHERLFRALNLTVVAPSQTTLDLWRTSSRLPVSSELVHPHATLRARGAAPVDGRRFRLAFPGMPAGHKGWPVFRDLALRFEHDDRYEFVHLGGRTIHGLPISFTEVNVTAAQPLAMLEALAASRADAALIWPLCRETFSFTAHEAAAAGAAVITNPDSGNVAAFVAAGGHGEVISDEPALTAAFESGDILKLARAARKPRLYDLAFSAMTADLIGAEVAA